MSLKTLHYETEAMAKLRHSLAQQNIADHEFEAFKQILIILENQGFTLKGPEL